MNQTAEGSGASFMGKVSPFMVAKRLSLLHIPEPTRKAENSYAVFSLKKKKTGTQLADTETCR